MSGLKQKMVGGLLGTLIGIGIDLGILFVMYWVIVGLLLKAEWDPGANDRLVVVSLLTMLALGAVPIVCMILGWYFAARRHAVLYKPRERPHFSD